MGLKTLLLFMGDGAFRCYLRCEAAADALVTGGLEYVSTEDCTRGHRRMIDVNVGMEIPISTAFPPKYVEKGWWRDL